MFIERPPLVYRLLYRNAVWRAARRYIDGVPAVYLTFDDGPTPESTPGVLDILDRYGVRAIFFMVADNARRYRYLHDEVLRRGHKVGNHTMHHLHGLFTSRDRYMDDVRQAAEVIGTTRYFRPPHGFLRRSQYRLLSERYIIMMQDVVSRDYNVRLSPERVVRNVLDNVRPGSVIVFHDSEKSSRNVLAALAPTIEGLLSAGYRIELPDD